MLEQFLNNLKKDGDFSSLKRELANMDSIDKEIMFDYLRIICKLIDDEGIVKNKIYKVQKRVMEDTNWRLKHGQIIPHWNAGE